MSVGSNDTMLPNQLAAFLIAQADYDYFSMSREWTDGGWNWHPLYESTQCGKPSGLAQRKGQKYTREFAHCHVTLDLGCDIPTHDGCGTIRRKTAVVVEPGDTSTAAPATMLKTDDPLLLRHPVHSSDPLAVCNDGSPPNYYATPPRGANNNDEWMIILPASGGRCANPSRSSFCDTNSGDGLIGRLIALSAPKQYRGASRRQRASGTSQASCRIVFRSHRPPLLHHRSHRLRTSPSLVVGRTACTHSTAQPTPHFATSERS